MSPVNARRIAEFAITIVKVALSAVVIGLVAHVSSYVYMSDNSNYLVMNFNMSYWQLGTLIIESYTGSVVADGAIAHTAEAVIYGFIAQLCAIILTVCTALCFTFAISGGEKLKKAGSIISLVGVATSIAVLVCGLVCASNTESALLFDNSGFAFEKFGYGNESAIPLVVLAAVSAVVSVASLILKKFNLISEG